MKIAVALLFFIILTVVLCPHTVLSQNKILLDRSMIILLTPGENTIAKLFDKDLTTVWFPGWNGTYPAEAIVDLHGSWKLDKIRLLNYEGDRKFKIYGGATPFELKLITNASMDVYNKWYEFQVNASVKYLKLVIPELKTNSPSSMELIGTLLQSAPKPPSVKYAGKANTSLKYIFGVNTFHWVPAEKQTNFTAFREYQEWPWMEQRDGKFTFDPTRQANGNYDEHYRLLKDNNIFVVPCIHQSPEWMKSGTDWNSDNKPIGKGQDPQHAASYSQIASFFFQLAARYGKVKVADEYLDIDASPRWTNDPINRKASGLNLLNYIECWNEPDKTWKGAESYFNPFEFAAMMSACADGHEGTLGPKSGIKTADPSLKVVMAGLCNLNLDYLKGMDMWFKYYRKDKKWPIDVINFHYYSNSSGFQYGQNSYGISPEKDNLKNKLREVHSYIKNNFRVNEMWLSEYGYDSNKGSMQRAPAIGSMTIQEVQAIWVVRSQLEIAASGIDKAFLYSIYDENDGEGLYASSGVLGTFPKLEKKPAWYYCNVAKSLLSNLSFTSDLSDSKIRKYLFSDQSKDVYALWLPTSIDAKMTSKIDLSSYERCSSISLIKSATIQRTPLVISPGTNLGISERPIFIECIKAKSK